MTPQEINIAIAEACGWKSVRYEQHPASKDLLWFVGIRDHSCEIARPAPDYCHDLNAMHEAELIMTGDQWRIFLGFLDKARVIPKFMSMDDFHKCWNSTAMQRAEAFLRTIGKWQEKALDQCQPKA